MIPGAAEYGIDLEIEEGAIEAALAVRPADVEPAGKLTFARNVFVPLTTACRYTCTYCTYFDPPGEASLCSLEEVRSICRRGAEAGCTEALFTFGDDPDARYARIHETLAEWGFESVHEYLAAACEVALEEGLLPHSNPGDQTREQLAAVAPYNASMGVMLETTAAVPAHAGPRGKEPGQRLRTIDLAGELGVPFTTGILVGIGEDWRDRAVSLLAIRALHERHGHVQEVIVQPVVENERWDGGSPDPETLRRTVAMARDVLPASVSVQVPPNLYDARTVLDCGVDDLGGVSPVTEDHVNPSYAWPGLDELRAIAREAGVPLGERLPVYERYLPPAWRGGDPQASGERDATDESDRGREWVPERVLAAIAAEDEHGRRFRAVLAGRNAFEPTAATDPRPDR